MPNAEGILSASPLTPEVIARAALAAMETAKPISDVRSTAEYRKAMVKTLTRRAVEVWRAVQARNRMIEYGTKAQ